MNPHFDLYLFKELVACYSFPSNYIYIQLLAQFCVYFPFNPETVNPNRWTTLTKLSASPSPLSDEDDVALITVEMEPGNDYVITTNTISF